MSTIIMLITIVIYGILTLGKDEVPKFNFGIVWVLLIAELLDELIMSLI